ncbi:MAG: voltage-gated potassium channel [Cyclobacteriaceae bacterium]|jgi:voltage-gated potassium channel
MPEDFKHFSKVRNRIFIIVFGTSTKLGKLFDIALLFVILGSILAVMLESVNEIDQEFGRLFTLLEWSFTGLFTLEYALRLLITRKPMKYVTSWLGIIDLVALLPTYLTLFMTGGSYLIVIRAFRLLRVFRILKLTRYLGEAQVLGNALTASKQKIVVFLLAVSSVVTIMGTLMYMIEGGENGFTSIPRSIYWAIVTVTTVGYGDIAPQTVIGQAFAALLMLMGYAIIAVPTGIVTAQIAVEEMENREDRRKEARNSRACENCGNKKISNEAKFCSLCGNVVK